MLLTENVKVSIKKMCCLNDLFNLHLIFTPALSLIVLPLCNWVCIVTLCQKKMLRLNMKFSCTDKELWVAIRPLELTNKSNRLPGRGLGPRSFYYSYFYRKHV